MFTVLQSCSFGYHAGGWGKPPVDETGKPLYGDVFGTNAAEFQVWAVAGKLKPYLRSRSLEIVCSLIIIELGVVNSQNLKKGMHLSELWCKSNPALEHELSGRSVSVCSSVRISFLLQQLDTY